MNFDVFDLAVLGVIAVLCATVVVHRMVNTDLGKVVKLNRGHKYILMTALGAGVIAFASKMIVIAGLVNLIPKTNTGSSTSISIVSDKVYKQPHYRWVDLPGEISLSTDEASLKTTTYIWETLPISAPSPENNHTAPAKVELGRKLFNDPLLSYDQTISCASCHDLIKSAGGDGRRIAIGINGQAGTRNTPTIWNAGFQSFFFWDGRASSLEEQAKGPLLNPVEMGMPSYAEVETRVKRNHVYNKLFADVFGVEVPITIDRIAEAIAAYERTLIAIDTPYDRFVNGDMTAMTDQQVRGMALFASVGCVNCHYGPNFSAASIFDDSSPLRVFPAHPTPLEQEFNLLEVNAGNKINNRSAWRVPSLRNVALTGPWLHNGSVTNLEDVVRIMAATQLGLSGHYLLWSDKTRILEEINRPVLTKQQVDDIVAFLYALSSDGLVKKDMTSQL